MQKEFAKDDFICCSIDWNSRTNLIKEGRTDVGVGPMAHHSSFDDDQLM